MSSQPAEIFADLRCDVNGKPFSVCSAGSQTVVEVPDLATGLRLVQLGSPRGRVGQSFRRWKRILDFMKHSVEFRISGRTVAFVGHGVGCRLCRLIGLPVFTIKPLAIASVLFSETTRGQPEQGR